MSGFSEHRSQLTQFQALFPSYSQTHGTFKITETIAGTGKKKGNARTISCGAPLQAWEEHFAGGPKGLGVIPLLDDGASVQWAAIDIDDNQIDHTMLEAEVRELGLPLVVCRSKSGGAHCYLFLITPCPAKDAVDALTNWAAAHSVTQAPRSFRNKPAERSMRKPEIPDRETSSIFLIMEPKQRTDIA